MWLPEYSLAPERLVRRLLVSKLGVPNDGFEENPHYIVLNMQFGVMSNVDCNTVVFFANAVGDPRSSNNMSGSLGLESETGEPESISAQRLNERRFAPLISDH